MDLTEAQQARLDKIQRVVSLKNRGHSNVEIARRMGLNESTVRELLKGGKL